ncbi:molecular chaperone [Tieghemostelium lacteum]|uniref:Molecular chaperone n=1 Tax=Tieghemostelium lacteum TaxID=361077 RepID=A0A152A4C8_TIELA|nr:molecular chaperone [Tieghemostelium lacteum]|eukprot:KYR01096.1 molecular chaperone [Tieghemostelium lacteum]
MNKLIRRSFSVFNQYKSNSSISLAQSGTLRNFRFYSTETNNNNNNNTSNNTNTNETKVEEKKTEETIKEDPLSEIETLKKELDETKKQLQYIAADRENVRNFAKQDVENAKKFGIQSFTKDLLEVVDQLEMALQSCKNEQLEINNELKTLHEGVKMTEGLFLKIMGNQGLTRFNPIGEKFDYNQHHAIYEIHDTTKEAGTVGNVVKQGYKLNQRLIRPAQVGVIKHPKK